jgi:glycosyltransferase involved in cell wall biosynthesis
VGVLEQVLDEVKPEQIRLLSGASVPERLARLLARGRDIPVGVAGVRLLPHVFARAYAALFPREERLRLRALLDQTRRDAPTLPAGEGRRFLFITCRTRHHFVVDPLVEAVRTAGAKACVIASSDEDPEFNSRVDGLLGSGVPAGFAMDYLPREERAALVRRYRPVLRRVWRGVNSDPDLSARLDWHGVSLLPVLRPFLRSAVEQSLLTALLHQEAAFRTFDVLRPDAVLITSDRRYAERAAALVARARGIPSVLCSGTLILSRDRINAFDVGDRIVVIGEHLRQSLIHEEGIEPGRVSVIGDPRSNAARLVPTAHLREEVRRDFGLAPGRPLIVLVSKYVSLLFSAPEREALIRTMCGAARQLPGVDVVVKVHPNEDLGRLRQQVVEWEWPEAILTKDYDIHRLFAAADAAVMVTSMAGLEAMALGCPVVAVQTVGKDFEGVYMPPYVSAGSVPRVDLGDPAGLAASLRRLLDDPENRAAVIERAPCVFRALCPSVDGRLAERLLALTDDILAARRTHGSREQAVVVGERRIGPVRRSSSRPRPASAPSDPALARRSAWIPRPECGADAVKFRPSGWTRLVSRCAKGGLSGRDDGEPAEPARHAGGARAESRGPGRAQRSRDQARPHLLLGALRRGKRGCPGCARCGALQGALGRDHQFAAPAARGGQGPAHHPLDRYGGSGRSGAGGRRDSRGG